MARKRAAKRGRTKRSGQIASGSANAAEGSSNTMTPREQSVAVSPTKRTPRKAAARGKWSEEQVLTSEKSVLIDADLVKLLSSSAAWHALDEDEKRQILDLLPADTHPNPDPPADDPNAKIPPLPDSFVRYSNNWRDCIRQFQIDLQNGRYDPEWLRQADEARQQRENGDFDSYKEREYEEFWGQKQKLDKRLMAGEAGKVKLTTLVDEGVIQVGDVWRFNYVYGRGADRIVIDKEARVHEINGSKLAFVLPAGERVFLQSDLTEPPKTESSQSKELNIMKKGSEEASSDPSPEKEDGVQIVGNNPEDIVPEAQIVQGESHMDTSQKQSQNSENASRKEGHGIDQTKNVLTMSSPLSLPPSSPLSSPPLSSPLDEPDSISREDSPRVQVVIMSPIKASCSNLKRPIPQPAALPPVKQKRGRPRKHPIVEREFKEEHKAESIDPPANLSTVQVVPGSSDLEPRPKPTPDMHNFDKTDMAVETPYSPLDGGSLSAANAAEDSTTTAHASLNMESNSDPTLDPKDEVKEPTTTSLPEIQSPNPVNKPEEVIVHDISMPQALIGHILAIDGRAKGNRTANAWKEIRCYRNNQDMGSLWDVRQRWYFKQK
ncbi:hypothetical protein N7486_009703 [Penicillium sp. IBT 16267x]|nr:hypothetical protein N7486_009703 [Penicillium sp. IBT 16267x]